MPTPDEQDRTPPHGDALLPRVTFTERDPLGLADGLEDLRPDPDYVCGASACDDPACRIHGPRLAPTPPEDWDHFVRNLCPARSPQGTLCTLGRRHVLEEDWDGYHFTASSERAERWRGDHPAETHEPFFAPPGLVPLAFGGDGQVDGDATYDPSRLDVSIEADPTVWTAPPGTPLPVPGDPLTDEWRELGILEPEDAAGAAFEQLRQWKAPTLNLDGLFTLEHDPRVEERLAELFDSLPPGLVTAIRETGRRMKVLEAVGEEAARAVDLHPNEGLELGPPVPPEARVIDEAFLRPAVCHHLGIPTADRARAQLEARHAAGVASWLDVLLEEVAEAAEAYHDTPEAFRAELVQVAGVAVNMILTLDKRMTP